MKGSTNRIRFCIDCSFIHTGGFISNHNLIFIREHFVHPRLWLRNPKRYIFNVNIRLKTDLQNVNLSVLKFVHNCWTKDFGLNWISFSRILLPSTKEIFQHQIENGFLRPFLNGNVWVQILPSYFGKQMRTMIIQ